MILLEHQPERKSPEGSVPKTNGRHQNDRFVEACSRRNEPPFIDNTSNSRSGLVGLPEAAYVSVPRALTRQRAQSRDSKARVDAEKSLESLASTWSCHHVESLLAHPPLFFRRWVKGEEQLR